ncbi:MAG: GntR family transcriptional regulator [Anaerolineae bacterium]|nr:GntR family transcriptional regulator [Anaerolineae bacterium]
MNKFFFELEKLIRAGEFEAGVPLPPINELAKRLNASETEIEDAIAELIYEGELERVRPKPLKEVQVPKHKLWGTLGGSHSITKEAKKRGETPGVEIINWQLVDAWASIAKRLALEPGDQVQIMERLRSANGKPVAIEISYFPAKYYPGITPDLFTEEGTGQSSFAVMEQKFGLKSEKAFDEVTVVCLEEREAKYLQVDPGVPVLQRFRVTLSDKGIPIKASRAVWLFHAAYEMGV